MENKIEIKGFFGDYKEVTKEKAKEYILNFRKRINNMNEQEKNIFLEKFIKGITIEELKEEQY